MTAAAIVLGGVVLVFAGFDQDWRGRTLLGGSMVYFGIMLEIVAAGVLVAG